MTSAAGTMSASSGVGFIYDNKLHATDLKTNRASKNMTIKTPDLLVDAAKFVQKDTSYTLTTSSYSMTSAAGTMSASTGVGFVYDNKLHATDLKTDSVPSQNGHKHPGDSGGTTGLPF
jgi:hypothetical protein